MASYGNYPKGAAPPQPYYGDSPSGAITRPTAVHRPPKKGGRLTCGLIGCLLVGVMLGGGGIGSCLFYTKWYLPQKARAYVDATEGRFQNISSIVGKIEGSIEKQFDESKMSVEPDVMEGDAIEAYNLTTELLEKTADARKAMPEDSSVAEALDESLKEYYDLTNNLGNSLEKFTGFYKDAAAILKSTDEISKVLQELKIKSLDDAAKASQEFRKKAEEFETYRSEFEKREVNEDTEEARKQIVKLISGMIVFLNETAKSLDILKVKAKRLSSTLLKKSKKSSKQAGNKFKKVLDEFDANSKNINKKIKEKYKAKIDKIIDKKRLVENYFKVLKEKYDMK